MGAEGDRYHFRQCLSDGIVHAGVIVDVGAKNIGSQLLVYIQTMVEWPGVEQQGGFVHHNFTVAGLHGEHFTAAEYVQMTDSLFGAETMQAAQRPGIKRSGAQPNMFEQA
jgi:hypothetical protein